MQRIAAIVIFLLIASHVPAYAAGNELPSLPEGFSWQRVPEIRGAFVVPEGWHFKQQLADGTLSFFITLEDIDKAGRFDTGLTANVFRGNPTAAKQILGIVMALSKREGATEFSNKAGPFLSLGSRHTDPREGLESVVIHTLGIVNTKTDTAYLFIFESPESTWDEAWKKGELIMQRLGIESEV